MNSFMSQFPILATTFNSYDQMVETDTNMKQNCLQWQFRPVFNVLE
jgi:hypothetical protein